ncbi:hypothetical protein [Microbacterium radiodurans]|uniref:Uncharacterized protein n=1 Tax=Microbacterium radiodurans TaxID=661398 RepID=A0A5J5IQU6_9MICO|nr:hypothetical protein [Microbacterium radiodurans]KAA9083761.1 hypothetical protein F6B42_14525 [Microbacterium radiodurans]
MRRVVYGMEAVITTDDVADAVMELAAALANLKTTVRLSMPIAADRDPGHDVVDILVGPGIPVLTEPAAWHGAEPDFSTSATMLRMHPAYPYRQPSAGEGLSVRAETSARPLPPVYGEDWDPDLHGY